jgi:hypothetical protein
MLSQERIAEIQARADRAVPGPWRVEEDWTAEIRSSDDTLLGQIRYPSHLSDAHFIAAARSDIPALLADREALLAMLRAVVAGYDTWLAQPDSEDGSSVLDVEVEKVRAVIGGSR